MSINNIYCMVTSVVDPIAITCCVACYQHLSSIFCRLQVRVLEDRIQAVQAPYTSAHQSQQAVSVTAGSSDDWYEAEEPTGVEIKSVDGYQGREKHVIVLSAVRSNTQGQVSEIQSLYLHVL